MPLSSFRKPIALVLFFLLVGFLCFWPFRFEANSPVLERLMDVCHVPLFGTIAWVLFWNIPAPDRSGWGHALRVGFLTCLLAALVEVIQPYTGRTESFDDFRNGFLGVVIALVAIPIWLRKADWFPRFVHGMVTVCLLAFVLQPAWLEWEGIQWRQQHFPLLGDFETPAELKIWTPQGEDAVSPTRVSMVTENFLRGGHFLKVVTASGDWAGVSYAAGGMDWSSFSRLALDIYNPGGPLVLNLRVDDGAAARFGREWTLQNGWTHTVVSLHDLERGTKKLNLHLIRRLALFTGESQPSHTFYLDKVRLE